MVNKEKPFVVTHNPTLISKYLSFHYLNKINKYCPVGEEQENRVAVRQSDGRSLVTSRWDLAHLDVQLGLLKLRGGTNFIIKKTHVGDAIIINFILVVFKGFFNRNYKHGCILLLSLSE